MRSRNVFQRKIVAFGDCYVRFAEVALVQSYRRTFDRNAVGIRDASEREQSACRNFRRVADFIIRQRVTGSAALGLVNILVEVRINRLRRRNAIRQCQRPASGNCHVGFSKILGAQRHRRTADRNSARLSDSLNLELRLAGFCNVGNFIAVRRIIRALISRGVGRFLIFNRAPIRRNICRRRSNIFAEHKAETVTRQRGRFFRRQRAQNFLAGNFDCFAVNFHAGNLAVANRQRLAKIYRDTFAAASRRVRNNISAQLVVRLVARRLVRVSRASARTPRRRFVQSFFSQNTISQRKFIVVGRCQSYRRHCQRRRVQNNFVAVNRYAELIAQTFQRETLSRNRRHVSQAVEAAGFARRSINQLVAFSRPASLGMNILQLVRQNNRIIRFDDGNIRFTDIRRRKMNFAAFKVNFNAFRRFQADDREQILAAANRIVNNFAVANRRARYRVTLVSKSVPAGLNPRDSNSANRQAASLNPAVDSLKRINRNDITFRVVKLNHIARRKIFRGERNNRVNRISASAADYCYIRPAYIKVVITRAAVDYHVRGLVNNIIVIARAGEFLDSFVRAFSDSERIVVVADNSRAVRRNVIFRQYSAIFQCHTFDVGNAVNLNTLLDGDGRATIFYQGDFFVSARQSFINEFRAAAVKRPFCAFTRPVDALNLNVIADFVNHVARAKAFNVQFRYAADSNRVVAKRSVDGDTLLAVELDGIFAGAAAD